MSRKFPVSIAHQLGAINRMRALREESEAKTLELLIDEGEEELKPATDPSTGSSVISEEAIHNFLGNVRLSDICLSHGDQFVPDGNSIDSHVMEKRRNRREKSPTPPVQPVEPAPQTPPAHSNKPVEAKRSSKPSKVNLWRAAANLEVETTSSKPKLESMLDGDFLNKLEGKMEKASISNLHDQLNQRMLKDASDFASVKPKPSKTKDKSGKKKKAEPDATVPVSSNRLRAKITSVQRFNEMYNEKKQQEL